MKAKYTPPGCHQVRDSLVEHAMEHLGACTLSAIAEHLATCPSCRGYAQDLSEVARDLSKRPDTIPLPRPDILEHVKAHARARWRQEGGLSRPARWIADLFTRPVPVFVPVLTVGALAVVALLSLGDPRSRSDRHLTTRSTGEGVQTASPATLREQLSSLPGSASADAGISMQSGTLARMLSDTEHDSLFVTAM